MEDSILEQINISEFDDKDTIYLLLKVIELLQKKKNGIESSFKTLEERFKEQEKETADLRSKLQAKEQEGKEEITKLSSIISSLSTEKDELERQVREMAENIRENFISIEDVGANYLPNNQLKANYIDINAYNELKAEVEVIKSRKQELESEYEASAKAVEAREISYLALCKSHIMFAIDDVVSTIENEAWAEMLTEINEKISSEIDSTEKHEDLLYKLIKPSSWFTKLSSLIWWWQIPDVKNEMARQGIRLDLIEYLHGDILDILKKNSLMATLPTTEFSDKIPNYEVDFTVGSKILSLMPDIEIPKNAMCEIKKLSINDKNGQCLTL